jgi:hypothetical protein
MKYVSASENDSTTPTTPMEESLNITTISNYVKKLHSFVKKTGVLGVNAHFYFIKYFWDC